MSRISRKKCYYLNFAILGHFVFLKHIFVFQDIQDTFYCSRITFFNIRHKKIVKKMKSLLKHVYSEAGGDFLRTPPQESFWFFVCFFNIILLSRIRNIQGIFLYYSRISRTNSKILKIQDSCKSWKVLWGLDSRNIQVYNGRILWLYPGYSCMCS